MLRSRVIPCLLLRNGSLVKTKQFRRFQYIGDPLNTCRIFNELEVDELVFLDIDASVNNHTPNFPLLRDIASECFMPLAYGGGISNISQAEQIFSLGFEKIILNTSLVTTPALISDLAKRFGSQSVVAAIDVRRNIFGAFRCFYYSGKKSISETPLSLASRIERLGAGEILLTSIDKEGTWSGFDLDLIKLITANVDIPLIAHGGAGTLQHIGDAIHLAGASAVALGSMVVYQKKDMGVLINFPDATNLNKVLANAEI